MMKILIVEDECLLADELAEKLMHIDSAFEIVAQLESVQETVEWLHNNQCDLIFMDIQLSDGLSFEIFEQVKISSPVIFTTAFDQYAIQAFDVNSIAYILKPIEDIEIQKALDKYEFLNKSYSAKLQEFISKYSFGQAKFKKDIIVSQGTIKKFLNIKDIPVFQADDRYVFAFTSSGQRFFCSQTLKELETILNPASFFRINRTFIINRDYIDKWLSHSKGRVKVMLKQDLKRSLIVSRLRTNEFKEWLKN